MKEPDRESGIGRKKTIRQTDGALTDRMREIEME